MSSLIPEILHKLLEFFGFYAIIVSIMKKFFLFISATVAALIAGVAVFVWSGRSPSVGELQEQGRKLEKRIESQARDYIKKPPIPAPEIPAPKKHEQPAAVQPKQPEPKPETQPQPVTQPPAAPVVPPGPPMEEINKHDKEKLIDILGE